MANTAKCERCGKLYEAGSEEQACGPNSLCRQCVKVSRWMATLDESRQECEKWASMTSGRHQRYWHHRAKDYAEMIEYIGGPE